MHCYESCNLLEVGLNRRLTLSTLIPVDHHPVRKYNFRTPVLTIFWSSKRADVCICYRFSLESCYLQIYLSKFYLLRQFYARISGTSQRPWRDKKEFPLFHLSCCTSVIPLFHKCRIWMGVLICSRAEGAHVSLNVTARGFCPNISPGPQGCLCPPHYPPFHLVSRKCKMPQVIEFHSAIFCTHLLSKVSLFFLSFYHLHLPFCSEQCLFLLFFCMWSFWSLLVHGMV